MVALTSAANRVKKDGRLKSFQVKGDVVIFSGALLIVGADGYLKPAVAEAGAVFAGVAIESVDATGKADGDVICLVETDGFFEIASTGLVIANVGEEVYASDDNTVSTTQGTNELAVGKILEVLSATRALVRLDASQVK